MNRIAAAVGLVVATNAMGQEARVIQIPSHPTYGQLIPKTMSGDGRVVVGWADYGSRVVPLLWTVDGEIEVLTGGPSSFRMGSASVCSYDGSIVAGSGTDYYGHQIAYRWVRGGGVTLLRGLPGQKDLHSATAISDDGLIVAGDVYLEVQPILWSGAYWTAQSGTVSVPGIPGGATSRAIGGMSADGSTMIGTLYGGVPFAWRSDTGSFIVPLPGAQFSNASGLTVTSNGDAIFGTAGTHSPGSTQAFTWNPDTGTSALPGIVEQPRMSIRAATADGRISAGQVHANSSPPYGDSSAVVYTLGAGTQFLADILRGYGLDYERTDLGNCTDISGDGRTIMGKDGVHPYWVVILPAPEAADYNVDRAVDFLDMADFVDCYTGNSILPVSSADMDGDGAVDFFDYDEFVRRFE